MKQFFTSLAAIYIYTIFLAFISYIIIYMGSDEEIDIHLKYKNIELNPGVVFFIPILNLVLLVYEWLVILRIFIERRNR